MKNKLSGHILAVVTVSIWSSTFIVSKFLLQSLSPLQILLIRFIIATVFLTLLYPRFKKPTDLREELLFLISGFSLALYFYFENSALQHTYSSNVSLIVATIPLITGALSALIYKTKFFTKQSVFGFMLAYFGVFLIIINGNKLVGIEPVGDFFALFAAVLFAIYTLVMQKIPNDYQLIERTRKVMFYGLISLGIITLLSGEKLPIELLDVKIIASLLFLGTIASSLAFIMWNKAIQKVGSVKTNQYIYLVPVLTTILSAIIIKERITAVTILGTVLILLGLYIAEKSK